jgi:hypothetical protein
LTSTSARSTAEAIELTFRGAPEAELDEPPDPEPPPLPKGKPPALPDPEPPAGRVCEVVALCAGQNW